MLHDPIFKNLIFHFDLLQDDVLTIVLCIGLTLIGAVFMHHLIEKPIYDYFMKETKSKQVNTFNNV